MEYINLRDFVETRKEDFSKNTELKKYLVNFVGEYVNLDEEEEVTVDLIVEVMAQEFPEFVLSVAEENYLRGYEQAVNDIEYLKGAPENDPS